MFDLFFIDDWNFWRGFIFCFSLFALYYLIDITIHNLNRHRSGFDCRFCKNWDCYAKRCAREWGEIEQNKK